MRVVFWVWVRGRWRRLTVERCPEVDGIELVGFPPARTRAIRDRIYALLVAADTPRGDGLGGQIDPPLLVGPTVGLDSLIAAVGFAILQCCHSRGRRRG